MPATVRETVAAVRKHGNNDCEVTVTAVAEELALDKSSALRRVRTAVERGYLKNLETGRGRPARLTLGDALPDEVTILPEPAEVDGCTVASHQGGIEAHALRSGCESGDAWEPDVPSE